MLNSLSSRPKPTSKPSATPHPDVRPAGNLSLLKPIHIIVVGDLHFATTPPSGRDDKYSEEIEAVLEAVRDYAESPDEPKASGILFLGDIFHRKGAPASDTIALAKILRRFRTPLYSIAGNHDQSPGDVESATTRQPYGVLVASGVLHDVEQFPVVIAKDGTSVGICGAAYRGDAYAAADRVSSVVSKLKHSATCVIVATHEDAEAGTAKSQVLAESAIQPPVCISAVIFNGHLHSSRGSSKCQVWTSLGAAGSVFVSAGSAVRTSSAEAKDKPTAYRASIVGSKLTITPLPLPTPGGFIVQDDTASAAGSVSVDEIVAELTTRSSAPDAPLVILGQVADACNASHAVRSEARDIIAACS